MTAEGASPSPAIGIRLIKEKGGYSNRPSSLLLNRINACALSVLAHTLKADNAVYLSEERIIRAAAYVVAGMNVSASLLDEDVAGEYELTVSTLNAKTLGLRVTTVLRRTHTFFMSE